jgi:hypothetical protein
MTTVISHHPRHIALVALVLLVLALALRATDAHAATYCAASGFEQAARKHRTTLRELERGRSTTEAGERIDRAFEQLREDGFLTISPDHPGGHPPANSRPENHSGEAQHDGGYYRALSRHSRASHATPCNPAP